MFQNCAPEDTGEQDHAVNDESDGESAGTVFDDHFEVVYHLDDMEAMEMTAAEHELMEGDQRMLFTQRDPSVDLEIWNAHSLLLPKNSPQAELRPNTCTDAGTIDVSPQHTSVLSDKTLTCCGVTSSTQA